MTIPAPVIENTLRTVHDAYSHLDILCQRLANRGIEHVPTELEQMACAALGNHEQALVQERIAPFWHHLQATGLAQGALASNSTPVLRVLAQVADQAAALAPLSEALHAAPLASPPAGVWRSATRVSGLWGEPLQIAFTTRYIDYLSVTPDPVFGLQPTLLMLDAGRPQHTGVIPIPVDDGQVVIRMRHQDGKIYGVAIDIAIEVLP